MRVTSSYLVKKDILPIASFGSKFLQVPILTDPMLQTKLLPELAADYDEDQSAT